MQGDAANRGRKACMLDLNFAKINKTLFKTFLPPAYSVVRACMLGNAAGTARRYAERNIGAETDLNLAVPQDYFIMPMPQSQLMCTLTCWGVANSHLCSVAKTSSSRIAMSTDCRQNPPSCKRNNSEVDQRHQSRPTFVVRSTL